MTNSKKGFYPKKKRQGEGSPYNYPISILKIQFLNYPKYPQYQQHQQNIGTTNLLSSLDSLNITPGYNLFSQNPTIGYNLFPQNQTPYSITKTQLPYYVPDTSYLCEAKNHESFVETIRILQNEKDELSDKT